MPISADSAVDDVRSIIEDALRVTGNVRSNDAPTLSGDTVAVSAVNGSAQGVSSQVFGLYGILVLGANGAYEYRLNNSLDAVQSLGVGDTLDDVFTYAISDQTGASSKATLTITINGRNDGPIVVHEAPIADEDGPPASGNALAKDFDREGDDLTVTAVAR